MSADRWSICPQCEAEREEKVKLITGETSRKLREAYGKLPQEEYHRVVEEFMGPVNVPELEETLREDFGVSSLDGYTLYAEYSCHCKKCGFKAHFKQSVDLRKIKNASC